MSEIEKLMQNASIKKAPDINNCYPEMMKCHHCEHYKVIDEYTGRCLNEVYPPFTAEKQLEMIKWLADNKCIEISKQFIDLKNNRVHCVSRRGLQFEESLAELVNLIWQSLSATEKAEIRRILE